jgi:hypothetical protein
MKRLLTLLLVGGAILRWHSTAPKLNQTVVPMPK